MFKATIRKPEVIEAVIQKPAGNDDRQRTKVAHFSNVRQPHPARLMKLPEDHILLSAVKRPPATDPPLKRTANARIKIGVAPLHLFKDRNRP